jgi:hypothetical protein
VVPLARTAQRRRRDRRAVERQRELTCSAASRTRSPIFGCDGSNAGST